MKNKWRKKKKFGLLSTSMRNQHFVGQVRVMQITIVLSEGLPLNSKYIEMGDKEGGLQAFLTQPPLVIVWHAVFKII